MRQLFLALAFFTSLNLFAQGTKVAVIDISQVLQAQPEYKKAQEDLDKLSSDWRQQISKEQDAIKTMYNRFQAEQVLLSEDAKRQREEEITNKERQVRDMQRDKFGPEGQLYKKRQELVKPIQDRVYAAIEKFANERAFDLVLDKGGSAGIIFANIALDKTQLVIDLLKK